MNDSFEIIFDYIYDMPECLIFLLVDMASKTSMIFELSTSDKLDGSN